MFDCKQTPEVRLLLTVMRSKTSTAQAFTASAIRLFAMLVGRLLERDDTCAQFEKIVQTPNDGHYSGHYVARSLMLLPIEGCHSITQKVFEV
jgi:uracil phosphoribosyltransferase